MSRGTSIRFAAYAVNKTPNLVAGEAVAKQVRGQGVIPFRDSP
jgi:hypothetical protein